MSAPETRKVPQAEAAKALRKGSEFAQTAKLSLGDSRWNSAGLNAVHAGISAADAVLIAEAGVRSVAKDHGAVMDLLEERALSFTASQRRQLGGLLKMKNQVAYDQRLLTENEARQLVDQANRLVKWAQSVCSSHGLG